MRSRSLILLLVSCIVSFGDLPTDPGEYAAWEAKMLNAVNLQKSLPPEVAIPKLGLWIYQLSESTGPNRESGDRPVYQAARSTLLSIPGHAEYFRDKVLAARRKLDEAKKANREGDIGYYQGELQHAQQDLATLGHLPSAETVRVLGEFLYDEVGYMAPPAVVTEDTTHRAALERPNYRFAAEAFNTLSLVDKPVPTSKYPQYGPPDSVLPWRQWFEEIKNGKRTFRFEGDPTEYDLNGPATKEKLERIARDRRREQERLAGRAKPGGGRETDSEATPLAKPASIAALLAACLLLAAAIIHYIRQSRKVA